MIEECTTAHEIVKSLPILKAIRWVAQAWENVTPDTIRNCFRKAGVLNTEFQVVTRTGGDIKEDPFADLDDSSDT